MVKLRTHPWQHPQKKNRIHWRSETNSECYWSMCNVRHHRASTPSVQLWRSLRRWMQVLGSSRNLIRQTLTCLQLAARFNHHHTHRYGRKIRDKKVRYQMLNLVSHQWKWMNQRSRLLLDAMKILFYCKSSQIVVQILMPRLSTENIAFLSEALRWQRTIWLKLSSTAIQVVIMIQAKKAM